MTPLETKRRTVEIYLKVSVEHDFNLDAFVGIVEGTCSSVIVKDYGFIRNPLQSLTPKL